jgi:tRNA(Ile)-lysidine synthase
VLESDKKIIWVVGKRIDDRYKLNSDTTSYLQFKFVPDN